MFGEKDTPIAVFKPHYPDKNIFFIPPDRILWVNENEKEMFHSHIEELNAVDEFGIGMTYNSYLHRLIQNFEIESGETCDGEIEEQFRD